MDLNYRDERDKLKEIMKEEMQGSISEFGGSRDRQAKIR
jgi:hypothetical protein